MTFEELLAHMHGVHGLPNCFDPLDDAFDGLRSLHEENYHDRDDGTVGANFGQLAPPHEVSDLRPEIES